MSTSVSTDQATRVVYATDNSIYQVEPYGVALPSSAAEISALVAANYEQRDRRPVVARGAGTGTNGQSLTDGIVLDLKRHLDRIIDVDPEARTAVVEPGVVTAALNAHLARHQLFWAPHTSTLNRATVGGMISTDAAGKARSCTVGPTGTCSPSTSSSTTAPPGTPLHCRWPKLRNGPPPTTESAHCGGPCSTSRAPRAPTTACPSWRAVSAGTDSTGSGEMD